MDRKEVSLEGVEWIDLAQNREKMEALVDTAVDLRVPYIVWNFLTDIGIVCFSRTALFQGVIYIIMIQHFNLYTFCGDSHPNFP